MSNGMNKYGGDTVVQISKVLGTFAMFVVEDTSETGFYRHLVNHLFRRREFGNYIGYEGHLFFENVQNLI